MTAMDWLVIVSVVSAVVALLSLIHNILSGRSKASKNELVEIFRRLNDAENRITAIERNVSHLPTNASISSIETKLGVLHGDNQKSAATLEGLQRQVEMILEHLMEGKRT